MPYRDQIEKTNAGDFTGECQQRLELVALLLKQGLTMDLPNLLIPAELGAMRATLTSLSVLCLGAAGSFSLAGPVEAPKEIRQETVARPFSWEGAFIGLNAGGSFGTTEANDTSQLNRPDAPTWSYDTAGFSGGIEWGYNWQRGCFVFGTASDLGYINLEGSKAHPDFPGTVSSTESNVYLTTRLRAGIAFGRVLLYGTGGAITVNYDATVNDSRATSQSPDGALRPGWTGGAGVEYALNDRWSLKAEYLYFELEHGSVDIHPGGSNDHAFFDHQSDGHIVRVGVDYHFGAPAPSMETSSDGKSGKSVVEAVRMEEEFSWTGPYIGLHFGWGSGRLKWDDEPPEANLTVIHHDQDGIFGGGQLGFNKQLGWLVLGTEVKFSGADIGKRSDFPSIIPGTNGEESEATKVETNIDWLASVAVRAGIACPRFLDGRFLAYGKIGTSDAHIEYRGDLPQSNLSVPHRVVIDEGHFATLFGGGIEYAIGRHWAARIEYDFADYRQKIIRGSRMTILPGGNNHEAEQYRAEFQLHTVEAGLNYRF